MSTSVGSCNATVSTVTCNIGTINPGPIDVPVAFVVVAQDVDVETLFDVHTAVTASTQDPDDTNNELIVTSSVLPGLFDPADLELTSVLNVPNPVTGGNYLGSTATVTNLGPDDATSVSLTDTLAPGESFVALGSDPSCTASARRSDVPRSATWRAAHVSTVLVVTKTPQVSADTTIHDAFAVSAPEDSTPGNDALDVVTAVRARRADFVAGYVPVSRSEPTWLNDATSWSPRRPRRDDQRPDRGVRRHPGRRTRWPGHRFPQRPCGAPFACMTLHRARAGASPIRLEASSATFIQVSVPSGYGASNPITGLFIDNWSVVGSGLDSFRVSFQNGSHGHARRPLPSCGGWHRTRPAMRVLDHGGRSNGGTHYAYGDLHTVVRFTNGGTFGRGR